MSALKTRYLLIISGLAVLLLSGRFRIADSMEAFEGGMLVGMACGGALGFAFAKASEVDRIGGN
ncbi:hypothetical protein OOZ54_12590 [Rhodopseudomonas palustris]|uniref:hypothetical protein n=1 Tax=Rhodopseudomonas palustris TaxID=1076 RepID=UPI0022F0B25E|nr:hypothetical protein [Rhodopseudomonas palustris]WBU27532.1 hypothetical protein OOZ54_12590 [Rhodopseudomonas palustris]